MSDERSDGISGRAGDPPLVDPALFWRDDVRRVLAALDIGGLYRVLGAEAGISQRQIAALAGQSQSEVSEIVAGRWRVESHQVLVRIADLCRARHKSAYAELGIMPTVVVNVLVSGG